MEKEEKDLRKELQLVNAASSYKALKNICFLAVSMMGVIVLVHFFYLNTKVENLSNRVIVIDSNGMASNGTVKTMADKDIVTIQVKAAIKYAVPFLYSFNSANYDAQIERGLRLFGNSGKEIHTNYINENVRERVFSSNLEVVCSIDDKDINVYEDQSGLHAEILFGQTFLNGELSSDRELVVKCDILKTKISEGNPFGYLIENWVIVSENRKIKK